MKKTFRQCAIIQNRHSCKEYVDYIVRQMDKLEKIEQIVNRPTGSSEEEKAYNYMMQVIDIKEVLEQENVDKTCDNCKYHTDAEEIHGKTPCGTCGRELINFCRKE